MAIRKVQRGRPRQGEQLKTQAQRTRDAKAKRKRDGRKVKEFVLNRDSYTLFEELRQSAGFGIRESSEFFEAMLLKVARKPWYGHEFTLPVEQSDVHD